MGEPRRIEIDMNASKLKYIWSSAVALPIIALVFASCVGEKSPPVDPETDSNTASVWKPTTFEHDPTCADCKEVNLDDLGDGMHVRLLINPRVDDELVQWASCMTGFIECTNEGGIDDCMASSPCPTECKARYVALVAGSNDVEDKFAALDTIFFNQGGLCRPPQLDEGSKEVQP